MLLEVEQISSSYGDLEAVHRFSMHLDKGQIVCILGPNGSGKSTILKSIAGVVKPKEGRVVFEEIDITGQEAWEILKMGICLLPQGRSAFTKMTVIENLRMGAYLVKDDMEIQERLKEAYKLFPVLEKRCDDLASKLSGGEQVMLCIARSLMSRPKILLLDEPSIGLSPKTKDTVYEKLKSINGNGISIVIVEQDVRRALGISDYAYVVRLGQKALEGKPEALANDLRLKEVYLGALHDAANSE